VLGDAVTQSIPAHIYLIQVDFGPEAAGLNRRSSTNGTALMRLMERAGAAAAIAARSCARHAVQHIVQRKQVCALSTVGVGVDRQADRAGQGRARTPAAYTTPHRTATAPYQLALIDVSPRDRLLALIARVMQHSRTPALATSTRRHATPCPALPCAATPSTPYHAMPARRRKQHCAPLPQSVSSPGHANPAAATQTTSATRHDSTQRETLTRLACANKHHSSPLTYLPNPNRNPYPQVRAAKRAVSSALSAHVWLDRCRAVRCGEATTQPAERSAELRGEGGGNNGSRGACYASQSKSGPLRTAAHHTTPLVHPLSLPPRYVTRLHLARGEDGEGRVARNAM
jgi:hypothetical protein